MTAVGQHIGFPAGTRVSGPGSVHLAVSKRRWGIQLAICGAYIDVRRGWGRTHRDLDCRRCLDRVAVPV